GLSIAFASTRGEIAVTRDVSFAIQPGERVGVVGESGCGKSVTGLSLMRLLPARSARVTGQVVFDGRDLMQLSEKQMRRVRGSDISMIFQEPMSALDPVFTVGYQLTETLLKHESISKKAARK